MVPEQNDMGKEKKSELVKNEEKSEKKPVKTQEKKKPTKSEEKPMKSEKTPVKTQEKKSEEKPVKIQKKLPAEKQQQQQTKKVARAIEDAAERAKVPFGAQIQGLKSCVASRVSELESTTIPVVRLSNRFPLDQLRGSISQFLVALSCPKGQDEIPSLPLLRVLAKGHPSLRYLDLAGQEIVSWEEDSLANPEGAVLLGKTMMNCHLSSLNVSSTLGMFLFILFYFCSCSFLFVPLFSGTAPSVVVFLECLQKQSSLVRVRFDDNLQWLDEEELSWPEPVSRSMSNMDRILLELTRFSKSEAAQKLVEFTCLVSLDMDEFDYDCGYQNLCSFFGATTMLCGELCQTLCYPMSFHEDWSLENLFLMTRLFENARRWTPERNYLFPNRFKVVVLPFLIIARRFGLPREVAFMILEMIARDFPICLLQVEYEVCCFVFVRLFVFLKEKKKKTFTMKSEMTMFDFFDLVGFPLDEVQVEIDKMKKQMTLHEDQGEYHDRRLFRDAFYHAEDLVYQPSPAQQEMENCIIEVLKAESATQLSSLLTFSTGDQFFVHLHENRLVYEDCERQEFLEMLEEVQGLFIRTFLPPRNRPQEHIRCLYRVPDSNQLVQCPADLCEKMSTQNGSLPPEANTTYL